MPFQRLFSFFVGSILVLTGCQSGAPATGDSSPADAEATDTASPRVGAASDDFPTEPISIVVSSDPGTSIDSAMRVLAPLLEAELGQPVVIVNRPGGASTNALNYQMSRPEDGHTLGGWTTSLSTILAQDITDYTAEDLGYVCSLMTEPSSIVVIPESPFQTVDDLVSYARDNPGELRGSGGAGVGSYTHTFALEFQDAADIEWTWVPFDSSTDARRALVSGDLDFIFDAPDAVEPSRVLAVTSADTYSYAPDVPTLEELGYPVGNNVAWRGILVTDGIPEDRVAVLIEAVQAATANDEWRALLESLGAEESLVCGDEFRELVIAEINAARATLEEIGVSD